ncbi:MAG: MFS transporter [Candidatus Melainabacteria bacterium]|nr:MFS transporter [Candidatus Melainabacteria bacterium]
MSQAKKNYFPLLFAVAFTYFTFGAITNVAGAIVPKIKETYQVSGSASSFLASVFFIAYGLTSVPFGFVINKYGTKFTLLLGALITTAGVFLFASVPGYYPNMISMFTCGVGITALQVSLNPLVKEISNPEKYSRNLTLFMVLFGVGSYVAPHVVTCVKSRGLEWNYAYWLFTAVSIVMFFSLAFPKYPSELRAGHVQPLQNSKTGFVELLKDPLMLMYTLAIFLYVGVEVGVAYNIGLFLEDAHNISTILGNNAESIKNSTIANYWLGLLLGRLLGSFVLDKIPTKKAIQIYISCAALALGVAVFSKSLTIVLWAFPIVGFFISIMFPSIYGLAIDSYKKEYSGIVSGILCTAIIGGAVIAPVITKVSEITGSLQEPNWHIAMLIAFACYAYIFTVGIWAKGKRIEG